MRNFFESVVVRNIPVLKITKTLTSSSSTTSAAAAAVKMTDNNDNVNIRGHEIEVQGLDGQHEDDLLDKHRKHDIYHLKNKNHHNHL